MRVSVDDARWVSVALTKVGSAKDTATLSGGRWRWRVLNLSCSRRARLAHRVCSMHDESVFGLVLSSLVDSVLPINVVAEFELR